MKELIIGNCTQCNEQFEGIKGKMYCSAKCKTMYYRLKKNPKQHFERQCVKCEVSYIGTLSSKYCSDKCSKVTNSCKYCGSDFIGHANKRYCSEKCKDAFKVRKDTGITKECLVCKNVYKINYGKLKVKKQVCSVRCSNIYMSSLSGNYTPIDEIEKLVMISKSQPSAQIVADLLNLSRTTVLSRAKEKYGSFRQMIESLRGAYLVSEDDKSYTANVLFEMIDEKYKVIGTREKVFNDLINPITGIQLRIDYFLNNELLAVEYHGKQHYEEVEFFNRDNSDTLARRVRRDEIKSDYLNSKNIPLVVFSYKDKITDDLISAKLDTYLK